MGEYAIRKSDGAEVKIGTCEDMYYLRADQADQVTHKSGNVDPRNLEHLKSLRFRFPWPDEDMTAPGSFDRYDRTVAVRVEGDLPPFEHFTVQFSAQAGYLLSIPCPEGPPADHGLTVHRNGFSGRVLLDQQAYRGGLLVGIFRCGGCGAKFNVPTWEMVEPFVVAIRAEGDRREREARLTNPDASGSGAWYHTVADRLAAGYAAPVMAEGRV